MPKTTVSAVGPEFVDPYERPSAQNAEDRVRAILELRNGSSLPHVNATTLLKYSQYLASRLTLPFEALYSDQRAPVVYPVTVMGLVDPQNSSHDRASGLTCLAQVKNKMAVLPLVDMEVDAESPNFQILEDYWYWLWNWQDSARPIRPR